MKHARKYFVLVAFGIATLVSNVIAAETAEAPASKAPGYATKYAAKDAGTAKIMKMLADWINFQEAYLNEKNGIDKVTVDEQFVVNLEAELLTMTKMAENGGYREREALLVALQGLGAFEDWYSADNEKLVSRGMALRYQNLREKAAFLANQLELILMPRAERTNSQNIDYALYLKLADQADQNAAMHAADKAAQAEIDSVQNGNINYATKLAQAAAKVLDDNYPVRVGEVVRFYSEDDGKTVCKIGYGENLVEMRFALVDEVKFDRMSDGSYEATFTRMVARDVPSQKITAWVDVRPKGGNDQYGKYVVATVKSIENLAPIDASAAAVNPLNAMKVATVANDKADQNAANLGVAVEQINANTIGIDEAKFIANDAHSRIDGIGVTVTGTTSDQDCVQTGVHKTIRNVRATAAVSAPARQPIPSSESAE